MGWDLLWKKVAILTIPIWLYGAPIAPSDLKLTANTNFVTLEWSDNSDDESGFKIFRDGRFIAKVDSDTHIWKNKCKLEVPFMIKKIDYCKILGYK